jgi:hypothetical protein
MEPYKESEEVLTEKVKAQPVAPRGGSLAGVHFASSYDACQRKYHLHFNMGIEEKYHDKALIFGSAIHEAKATFYETWDPKAGVERGLKECDDRRDEFYSIEEYDFARSRVSPLMKAWYNAYGFEDKNKYKIIAIEEEIRLPVPFTPGFVHTQRHDAVLEDQQNGDIFTFDTKTASSSLDFTLNSVRLSDQVTAYIWGGTEVFGKRYKGFVIDVQYWSTRSTNPHTIRCQRSEVITRTDHELKVFQAQIGGIFNEIQAKERALALGTPSPFLFRRNSYYCYAFFRKCAYADVCGLADTAIPRYLPDHLSIVDTEGRRIDGMTYDNIYYGEGAY